MTETQPSVKEIFVKHVFVSFLLGGIPLIILFKSFSKQIFIQNTRELVPNSILQLYFIAVFVVYILLSLILTFFWLQPDSRVRYIVVCTRAIFREAASGLKSITQTIIGVIFTFCFLWLRIEPNSFTFVRFGYLLLCAFVFLCGLVVIEIIERRLR